MSVGMGLLHGLHIDGKISQLASNGPGWFTNARPEDGEDPESPPLGDRYFRHVQTASGQYETDYRHVAEIKKVEGSHGLCLLLVHHLRKMEADDLMHMFSGTPGLTGLWLPN